MKILFLMLNLPEISVSSNMYLDLVNEFRENGHTVSIMAPDNQNSATYQYKERGYHILRVKTRTIIGATSLTKKGIGLALLPSQYKRAYKKYFRKEHFDWIFMPTPPITLIGFVVYLKKKTDAKFYLILRDVHPQSAASIGLIKFRFMYDYLARRASLGYKIADYIGCMSQGNIDYIAANYPMINVTKLVLLMNWQKDEGFVESQISVREKYDLQDKFITLFGGNIGLGQRIENIVSLAKHYIVNPNIVFLIIGKGIRKDELENIAQKENLHNIRFLNFMPRAEYLSFVQSVDVGLISINEKYTVPTCPSKVVSYMALKIPIMAIINPNNDYGDIIYKAGAGYWAVGGDDDRIFSLFDELYEDQTLRKMMGEKGYTFYLTNLTSAQAYRTIMNQINHYGKS